MPVDLEIKANVNVNIYDVTTEDGDDLEFKASADHDGDIRIVVLDVVPLSCYEEDVKDLEAANESLEDKVRHLQEQLNSLL